MDVASDADEEENELVGDDEDEEVEEERELSGAKSKGIDDLGFVVKGKGKKTKQNDGNHESEDGKALLPVVVVHAF